MDLSVHIQEHMEVVGSDGKHVAPSIIWKATS